MKNENRKIYGPSYESDLMCFVYFFSAEETDVKNFKGNI